MKSNMRTEAGRVARRLFPLSLMVACLPALLLAACSGGGSDQLTPARLTPPPLDASYRDARTNRPLGASPENALDQGANGVPAGTLLARSDDGRTCVFANGRNGWNRAAC